SSTYVELQVIRWLLEIMGFPASGGGILVSGGTMANFIGLAAARDAQADFDVWSEGLQSDSGRPRLTFYGSEATHGWAPKTANVLGLGVDSFRKVPTTNERIDVPVLREFIERDRAAGHQPFCVIGTAGSVNTGACDDLAALADLCESERLWFHVDGAFGAWARLSSTHADLVRGLDRADSLAFDLHKWGYLPFESACALVRSLDAMRRPFAIQGAYIAGSDRGTIGAGIPFADRSIELTRSFKALKVWMSLRAHGLDHLAALIDQNLAQARELVRLVEESPQLELVAPCPLNVVCFRYVTRDRSDGDLNAINTELLLRLQESGFVVPSSTTIDGRFALRAAITNHRTRWHDLAQITELVVTLGREIESSS
ncbi:MAG: pyridoxal-dependent decarboxylase, partial [Planctomycetota bacterium]